VGTGIYFFGKLSRIYFALDGSNTVVVFHISQIIYL